MLGMIAVPIATALPSGCMITLLNVPVVILVFIIIVGEEVYSVSKMIIEKRKK